MEERRARVKADLNGKVKKIVSFVAKRVMYRRIAMRRKRKKEKKKKTANQKEKRRRKKNQTVLGAMRLLRLLMIMIG
jgi:hypothetical protein